MTARRLLVFVFSVVLASLQAASAQEPVEQIDWSDLQPEGEEEILDELYRDFYEDLDRRRAAARSPLSGIDELDGMGKGGGLGGLGSIAEGSPLDTMPQIGTFNTVPELDGAMVEIPGFIVPLDITGETVKRFLLVPYFGACLHTPPPPPNQIVYVTVEEDLPRMDIWMPYWAEGRIETVRADSDLGDAAYTMQLTGLRPYE